MTPSVLRPHLPARATAPARGAAATLAVLAALALLHPAPAQAQAAAPAAAASAPTLRPEVGKPLQAAQQALQARNYADGLARVAEAEAVPGLTPYETYILRRMKGPALFGTGDAAGALAVFESVLPMPELPAADRLPLLETCVKLSVQLKDYPRALRHLDPYLAGGGSNAELQRLQAPLLANTGDHAGAVKAYQAQVAADQAAGRAPSEGTLRSLAASQDALGDAAGYQATVERLAIVTGKADYWGMLVNKVQKQPGYADERLRLDLYRLRRAVGLPLQAPELADMAYRANQAGLPAEAKALVDEGFAAKLLGEGADAAEDRKLRDTIHKSAAADAAGWAEGEAAARRGADGNAMVNLGFALSGAGQHERALSLMTAGVAKGGLRRPDEAMLHLAVAQWRAGQRDAARQSLAAVKGSDGTAAIAALWAAALQRPAQ